MGDGRAGCQGCAAGVGEKVQDFELSVGLLRFCFLYYRRKPIPVHRLFGEKSRMFEAERL